MFTPSEMIQFDEHMFQMCWSHQLYILVSFKTEHQHEGPVEVFFEFLERQVSYFFKATLHLKPATVALKIGHLAFQVVFFLPFFHLSKVGFAIYSHGTSMEGFRQCYLWRWGLGVFFFSMFSTRNGGMVGGKACYLDVHGSLWLVGLTTLFYRG